MLITSLNNIEDGDMAWIRQQADEKSAVSAALWVPPHFSTSTVISVKAIHFRTTNKVYVHTLSNSLLAHK